MMKLNKRGWGMKEMIIFSLILLAFLLIAIVQIMRLYNGLTENNNSTTTQNTSHSSSATYSYEEVESFVLNAGLDYYNEYYNSEEDVRITTDRMKKKGFLTSKELRPKGEKKECSGYVHFIDGEPAAYIQCTNYVTQGYGE